MLEFCLSASCFSSFVIAVACHCSDHGLLIFDRLYYKDYVSIIYQPGARSVPGFISRGLSHSLSLRGLCEKTKGL